MDTTAAAELGGGLDGGGRFWDSGGGAGEPEGWAAEKQQQGWGGGGGAHNRGSGSATPNIEPPPKRLRNMSGGGADGYGSGSGNFKSASPMGGFTAGASDHSGGFGPGGSQRGSPGVNNNFPTGGPNAGFPQGPPPPPLPPETPTGDQSAGQGIPRGRGMGSIFYKTKLCSRFRHGNCPYNTNCNFAHGMEELRRPPPGWEESPGAVEGGVVVGGGGAGGGIGGMGGGGGGDRGEGNRGGGNAGSAGGAIARVAPSHSGPNQGPTQGANPGSNPGSNQGPTQGSNQGPTQYPNQGPSQSPSQGAIDMQRFHKTRPCKKYFSELGCPYGDRCNFLHDEPNPQMVSKSGRESVVVTVVANGGGSGSGPAPAVTVGGAAGGGSTPNQRPPNWKTRLCNKWETTGNCPFGEKCHFAHGTAELQRYGGGPFDSSSLEGGAAFQLDSRPGMNSSGNHGGDGEEGLQSYPDSYPQTGIMRHPSGHPLQQTPRPNSGMGPKSAIAWKGPTTGVSTIYGDWLEDNDWTPVNQQRYGQPMPSVDQKGTDFSSEPLTRKQEDQRSSSPFLKPGNGSARIYAQG